MSFLSELRKQRGKLKETETVVTDADGQRFVEKLNESNLFEKTACQPATYGFVVDTKPDDIPVLVTNYLYIGSQDCASNVVLSSHNISNVLSVGIDVEINHNYNHKFVQCLDLPESDIKPVLSECLPFIATCVAAKQYVLVHCNAGVSRTSMVAIAYLMQYTSMSYSDAYDLVKSKRPAVKPNAGFVKQLKLLKPV